MKLKAQIEAILFLTDKPIKAAVIARQVNQDVQIVRQALLELIHDYEDRDGGLEISNDEGYAIQVRDEYASIIDDFAPMDMPIALVRTLSAIALKQPVTQSEIIKIRGAGAYEHVKELMIRELIQKKEEGGRSPALSTTKKFQEYFRLSQDAKSLRQDLSKQKKDLANTDNGEPQDEDDAPDSLDGSDFSDSLNSKQDLVSNMPEEVKFMEELSESIRKPNSKSKAESMPREDAQVSEDIEEFEVDEDFDNLENVERSKANSQGQLEKIFAESYDSSLVFRPSDKDIENVSVTEESPADDTDSNEAQS